MQCFIEFTTTVCHKISNLLLVVSSPNMTGKEKTSDTALETSIIEDDISGREKLLNTLYTMHLCKNIKCEICNKLKNILKIFIKISCSHTNIYIHISIHVIDMILCHRKTQNQICKTI